MVLQCVNLYFTSVAPLHSVFEIQRNCIVGNVVTIKLSENQENVLQTDNTYLTMIAETHFQMNYLTGEWNRIRKYRRLEQARMEDVRVEEIRE